MCPKKSASEEEGVEGHRLGERHAKNGLDENFAGRARVAAHGFDGLGPDHAHTDGGGGTSDGALEPVMQISFNCGDYVYHMLLYLGLRWLIRSTRHAAGISTPGTGRAWKRLVGVLLVISMVADQADVNRGKKGEHEGLYGSNEQFKKVEGHRYDP